MLPILPHPFDFFMVQAIEYFDRYCQLLIFGTAPVNEPLGYRVPALLREVFRSKEGKW